MALAGAPRLILFDEPAAGLSPAERARAGRAAARAAGAHELRPDRARPRHRAARGRARHRHAQRPRAEGRHARTRSRTTRRCRRSTWGAGTDGLVRATSRDARQRRRRGPRWSSRLDVYYGRAHALQGVASTLRARRARHRRPQRHGQDDAVQRDHRLVPARGSVRWPARRSSACAPQRDHAARHRLRAAGPARVAFADGRRDAAPGARGRRRDVERVYHVPAPGRAQAATAAPSSPAASSRCWPSAARCCSSRSCS